MRDWQNLVLRACRADSLEREPLRRTFVLSGGGERRVNVSASQHRALNLVAALLGTGVLNRPPEGSDEPLSRLLIIGAGASGWTAAVAAASQGVQVLLVDESQEPMMAQRAAIHRPLFPSLYDWPVPNFSDGSAGLGYCNWRNGNAASARRQIVAGGLADIHDDALCFLSQCAATSLEEHGDEVEARIVDLRVLVDGAGPPNSAIPTRALRADAALVATGYLPERRVAGGLISGSYWRPVKAPRAGRAVVVGDGDGALNEVLRIATTKGEDLFGLVAPDEDWPDRARWLEPEVMGLRRDEGRWRERLPTSTFDGLAGTVLPKMDRRLESLLSRTSCSVEMIASEPVMTQGSFLLNRYLVSRLAHLSMGRIVVYRHEGACGAGGGPEARGGCAGVLADRPSQPGSDASCPSGCGSHRGGAGHRRA